MSTFEPDPQQFGPFRPLPPFVCGDESTVALDDDGYVSRGASSQPQVGNCSKVVGRQGLPRGNTTP